MRRLDTTTRLTVAAMSSAIGIVCLYAASIVPAIKLALMFLSSLCIWIPLNEPKGFPFALLTYIATGAISLLIIPDKLYSAAYLLFLGCFGMIKYGFDRLIPDRFVSFALKIIACDIISALAFLLTIWILELNIFTMIPEIPLWIIIVALQVAFALYELLYSLCAKVFDVSFRELIVPRR